MRKATKVSGGYATKRKARIGHDCNNCWRIIEPGEEYYQLSLTHNYNYITRGYITKYICEKCWKDREMKA